MLPISVEKLGYPTHSLFYFDKEEIIEPDLKIKPSFFESMIITSVSCSYCRRWGGGNIIAVIVNDKLYTMGYGKCGQLGNEMEN
jgi:hypothetical protein